MAGETFVEGGVGCAKLGGMLPWFEDGAFPLYLAPMAGFTDVVFRSLCKEQGADVMVTEFVMADKFLSERGQRSAWETVDFTATQRPMGVQLFGSIPENMAGAAEIIVERLRPDFIDLNFGCPAPKVVGNCAGSSLLRDLDRLEAVVAAVVGRVGGIVPVTAKIRLGWDDASVVAVEASRRIEACGAQAVAIHGRTKEQGYRGSANWDWIEAAAEAVTIPVIGNGAVEGISLADHVARVRDGGKVRGLMIGRAALGYPWIFREVKAVLAGKSVPPPPPLEERWEVLLRYARMLRERPAHADRWDQLNWMRSRLKSFTKVLPGCRHLRQALDRVVTYEDLEQLATEHLRENAATAEAEATP